MRYAVGAGAPMLRERRTRDWKGRRAKLLREGALVRRGSRRDRTHRPPPDAVVRRIGDNLRAGGSAVKSDKTLYAAAGSAL